MVILFRGTKSAGFEFSIICTVMSVLFKKNLGEIGEATDRMTPTHFLEEKKRVKTKRKCEYSEK